MLYVVQLLSLNMIVPIKFIFSLLLLLGIIFDKLPNTPKKTFL